MVQATAEGRALQELEIQDWGLLDYRITLSRQRAMAEARADGLAIDRLVFVEHPPVVTIGRSGTLSDLRMPEQVLHQRGIMICNVERGGMATFHGPGQLVAYPVIELREKDLHLFLSRLLDVGADVLSACGLVAERRKGRPGLWVGASKIASVGIAVRRWVTYHGIALNVNLDPRWFSCIVACGEPEETITSMRRELGRPLDVTEVKSLFAQAFCKRFGYTFPAGVFPDRPGHPEWLRAPAPSGELVERIEAALGQWRLSSVCHSARCPNLGECFSKGTVTFMILGTRCTRTCGFCAVEKARPDEVDPEEPVRVARAARSMGLRHVVVTSVTRDDLPDGGAEHFAQTIRCLRRECPGARVEVLVPDFRGSVKALQTVCGAAPDMFAHNVETVTRLYPLVRREAVYRRSLEILRYARAKGLPAKSGLMLGLGEKGHEILDTLFDLRRAGCTHVTIGQYLAPSRDHVPVARFAPPEEFARWARTAEGLGFSKVAAGPLVRSSYRAGEMCGDGQGPVSSIVG